MKISKTGVDKMIKVLKEIVISFYDVSSSEENKRLILLSQWGLLLIPFFLNNDVPMGVGGREKTKQNLRQMF